MAHRLRRFAIAISTAAVVLSLTTSLAMAGEVTGSGKNERQNQGKSWCSFSGLNDRHTMGRRSHRHSGTVVSGRTSSGSRRSA